MLVTTALATILSFSGAGFDATRVFNPSVAHVGTGYNMLYGGLPFANNIQIGLATSTDGVTWTKYGSNPVITNGSAPAWASYREVPATLLYNSGTYNLWFQGDNTNLSTDAGRVSGFGHASSTDGTHWTIDPTPIRLEPWPLGVGLASVAVLDDKYYAYLMYVEGGTQYVASSTDGINFSPDVLLNAPNGYHLLATTTTTIGGQSNIVGIWQAAGSTYYGLSSDGVNFTMQDQIDIPANFGVTSALIEGNRLQLFGDISVGNINWNYGNVVIGTVTAAWPDANVPEPSSTVALLCGMGGLMVLRRYRNKTAV